MQVLERWTWLILFGYQQQVQRKVPLGNCGSSLQLISRGVNNVAPPPVTEAWIHHNEVVSWPASTICLFIPPHLTSLFHPCLLLHSFTHCCFFTLSLSAAFLLFHPQLEFCFFTLATAAFLLFHPRHNCFFAFLLWPAPELPPSVLLCFNHKVGPTEQNRSSISGGWTLCQFNMTTRTILM